MPTDLRAGRNEGRDSSVGQRSVSRGMDGPTSWTRTKLGRDASDGEGARGTRRDVRAGRCSVAHLTKLTWTPSPRWIPGTLGHDVECRRTRMPHCGFLVLQSAHVCDGEEGVGTVRAVKRESRLDARGMEVKRSARSTAARGARTSRAIASLVPMATRGAIGGVASERTHPVYRTAAAAREVSRQPRRRHCPDLPAGACRRGVRSPTLARVAACGAEVPSAPTSLVRPRGARKGCERSKRINERE